MTKEELWQNVLNEMELKISQANFATWFKDTHISSIKNDVVEIAVPNYFAREWLVDKYHKPIFNIFKNNIRDLKRIDYIIVERYKSKNFMDSLSQKERFIEREILLSSLSGALKQGRGYPVYKPKPNISDEDKKAFDEDKKAFREYLKSQLQEYFEKYYRNQSVDDNNHIRNIQKLIDDSSKKHGCILRNEKLSFGRAQKLLNLYLKYKWVLGHIQNGYFPPHCPFDSKILSELKIDIPFVRMTKEEYEIVVKKAKEVAGTAGLTMWELKTFNELRE